MPYEKIPFVNQGPPGISAERLNHIQTQYDEAKADYEGGAWTPPGNTVKNAGGVPELLAGTLAERPQPGTMGRCYFATDTGEIYRDTGSAWELAAASQAGYLAHLAETMPHRYQDIGTGTTYQYGFKQQDNHLVFMYQEVV